MKKLLISSTAMVVASSAAFADGHTGVSLSGYAEMGIAYVEDATNEYTYHSDMDVSFKLSGETDGGISFGAKIDLDEVSGGISSQNSPAAVFISGDFGTLTLGDTDGALDKALSEVAFLTAIADDHSTHSGYSGNSALDGSGKLGGSDQILRWDYSFGDVGIHLSYELGLDTAGSTFVVTNTFGTGATVGFTSGGATVFSTTTTSTFTSTTGTTRDDVLGIGLTYSADLGGTDFGIGLGYQEQGSTSVMGASLSFGVAGLDVVLNYWDLDAPGTADDDTYSAIGVAYTVDALSLTANYGEFDSGGEGFGVAMNYDLGGGAVVMLGYSDDDAGSQASFGLGLSF